MYFYERHAKVEALLASTFALAPEDIETARLILASPDVLVLGPNHE